MSWLGTLGLEICALFHEAQLRALPRVEQRLYRIRDARENNHRTASLAWYYRNKCAKNEMWWRYQERMRTRDASRQRRRRKLR